MKFKSMAAADIDGLQSLGDSSGSLTKTREILLETMQLVEIAKPETVPNHLLETKIYSKLDRNNFFQAKPATLHFAGFEIGSVQRLPLQIFNVSNDVQRMHVVPPQTKYFNIRYEKPERLVAGRSLDCIVEFVPDEWRYYYDAIRIHTKGNENLLVPIHAYPVMDANDFPSHLSFPPVPVGHSVQRVIPLRCMAPIDFEFELNVPQPHPAFRIDPVAGIVPANGEVDISIIFSPTEFSTAYMLVELNLSQFGSKPLQCHITGSSMPGLAKELTELAIAEKEIESTLDPRSITPVDRARKRRMILKKATKNEKNPNDKEFIEKDGIRFPSNLDTPSAVANILNQEPGKLKMKDIRNAVAPSGKKKKAVTKQMKEAVFDMAIRKNIYEERQNQLRWQVKLGDTPVLQKESSAVLNARSKNWSSHRKSRGDPDEEKEFLRKSTSSQFRRTNRDKDDLASMGIKFDVYRNDMWYIRQSALDKFRQAARKVIIRSRADIKLVYLKKMILEWGKRKQGLQQDEEESGDGAITIDEFIRAQLNKKNEDIEEIAVNKIRTISFPHYVPPDLKDDMAVDSLGSVPFIPTTVVIERKYNFFNLKVPQQYKLLKYHRHDVHEASQSYVSPTLARPLRTGAEDEVIVLPEESTQLSRGAHHEVTIEEAEPVDEGDDVTTLTRMSDLASLHPPRAMFKAMEYPSLHIFNPSPGMQVFQPPLPYAETDSDFRLCPIPAYTNKDTSNLHMITQKKFLDKDDVIRGVMQWKRFPSQGLTSLSSTPTLTNVWVPRWDDIFSEDTLTYNVPKLYDGLSNEDMPDIQDEEDESVVLTPDMVNAQFPLVENEPPVEENKPKSKEELAFPHGSKIPSTNIPVSSKGPVPREKREEELAFFMTKKSNKLGQQWQAKFNTLNNLKTSNDLVLK